MKRKEGKEKETTKQKNRNGWDGGVRWRIESEGERKKVKETTETNKR